MFQVRHTAEDVLRAIKDDKIQRIDLRFTDLPGRWQRCAASPSALESFEAAVAFDGRSIRPTCEIRDGDVLVVPDPASAFLDPFAPVPTLVLICSVRDPATGKGHSRDSRSIAQKAEAYLQTAEVGDTANFGLQLQHFVFDGPRVERSAESDGEAGAADGAADAMRRLPAPPVDVQHKIRTQIVATLANIGIKVAAGAEDLGGCQGEVVMRFGALTRAADNVMIYKYVVSNVARRCGAAATFMPKPLFSDGGSGMHVHQSIWHGERALFAGDGYAGTSALMRHYVAGLLEHTPALLAICAPAAHSGRVALPPFEVPVDLGYSQRNRSAACRVPMDSLDPKAKRIEFRCPDPSCNPYLAFAAMLMAGIDGFHNRLYNFDPDEPIEKFCELPARQPAKGRSAAGWLEESLDALAIDHAFLLHGGVFAPDVIEDHLSCNRER